MSPLRARIYRILDADDGGTTLLEHIIDVGLLVLVLANAAAVVLESVHRFHVLYHNWFAVFEEISVYIFTIEYALRVWSAVEVPPYNTAGGRLRFIRTPLALIDLLAILPFYLTLGGIDLRILRIVRLFRVLKVSRYVTALGLIQQVVHRKRHELAVTAGLIAIILVLVSSVMYYVESEAQPEKFGSIPDTMWWGVATLTTVGYGDVYPITPMGKVLSSLFAVLGLGLFALPTGILAAGFAEHLNEQRAQAERKYYCPHCGRRL